MTRLLIRDLLRLDGAEGRNLDAVLDRPVLRISTDTRALAPGDVFVALRGERFDAHTFVAEALTSGGAILAIVRRAWLRRNARRVAELPIIAVEDTRAAYGAIAAMHRHLHPIPVMLITGSNGKTSTRELVAAVLATKYRVLRTEGNYNNLIGLPATLLQLTDDHQVAVVEAGTNQPGDIPALCAIAGHTHAAITNIGRAHIERLVSREGIAAEKGVVFKTLPKDGTAIVNADEPLVRRQVPRGRRRILFGTAADADVRITAVELDAEARPIIRIEAPAFLSKPLRLHLRARGIHSAMNAALALATGFAFGCSATKMKAALEAFESYDKRLRILHPGGITVIDDTYNANPDSVRAAIATLAGLEVPGRKVAVLGDMLELGRSAADEHRGIGRELASAGIPYVLTVGRLARAIAQGARSTTRDGAGSAAAGADSAANTSVMHADHFPDKAALLAALDALVEEGDAVLVKGSRGAHMEEIVAHLAARDSATETKD